MACQVPEKSACMGAFCFCTQVLLADLPACINTDKNKCCKLLHLAAPVTLTD
jgi:hypothetical protein